MNNSGAEPPVLTRVQGGAAHVTLNRPRARNAVTIALARALHDALSDAAVYADLIVVRGAGGQFCAGADAAEVARLRRHGPDALRPLLDTLAAVRDLIAELPVPVLAAVEGSATGEGFDLVQAVDIAVVRDDAVLTGAGPAGGGSVPRLAQAIGLPRAMGHLLTGEPITGRQAADWGLVYRSVSPSAFEPAVAALVVNLEGRDRGTLTGIKRLARGAPAAGPDPEMPSNVTQLPGAPSGRRSRHRERP